MVADVVGGRFVQHVPIDVVVDLRKREMEHGERVILAVSSVYGNTVTVMSSLFSLQAL